MKKVIEPAVLTLGLLAGACGAASAQEAVQTNASPTLEQQVQTQARQIDQQNAQIQALQDQIEDLTRIMGTRMDRVESQTESGRVVVSSPGPRFESPNARNTFTMIGAVQATFGTVDQDPDSASTPILHGGSEIKRARIGVQGTAFNDFAYQAEIELAALSGNVAAAARDLYVQYNGIRPFSFTVGNIKPQTGLEASFSDRSNAQTFIESSMLTSMITAPGTRYVGLRANTGGSNWSTTLGVYGDDVNNNGVSVPNEEGFGVHGRATFAPINSADALLHLGASGYWREIASGRASTSDPITSQLRVRATPESTIDSGRLVDTGNLNYADTVQLLALEAALMRGPFGLQAEWGQMQVEQLAGRPQLQFSGAYVGANWFLTGESRVYDARTGLFTRFTPRNVVDPAAGTWGAWELAARWSTINLDSEENNTDGVTLFGARGGEETNYTLGLKLVLERLLPDDAELHPRRCGQSQWDRPRSWFA